MISIFRIACKNLLRKRARSVLTAVGIALAAWVLVSLLGFIRGYRAWLNSEIDNQGIQMLLTAKGSPYEATTLMLQGGTGLRYLKQSVADSIAGQPEVERLTPMLMVAVLDPNKGRTGGITAFLGVDAISFPAMKSVLRFSQGRWFTDNQALEAVFGYEAAELEQREVGDKYLIPEYDVEVTVVGVLERCQAQDDGAIFLPIGTVKRIFNRTQRITGIGIKVKRDADIARFEKRLNSQPDIQVVNLSPVKRTVISLASTGRIVTFSIALIAILAAVVGVAAIVRISVMERSREFGILKSLGARDRDILGLVWLETLALCLSGGLAGTATAWAASGMTDALVRVDVPLVLLVLAAVTAVGLASGVYPSWRAVRVRPLRYAQSKPDLGPAAVSDKIFIGAQDLTKTYRSGQGRITAIDGISLELKRGDFVAFVGPAGSGKTTLFNILGCLDDPTSGRLELDGQTVFDQGRRLVEPPMTMLRRELFGYVSQDFSLIPNLTVYENVVLPFAFHRKPGVEKAVDEILVMLGIDRRRHHLPAQISGSESQRVALARALVSNPKILLADEPTEHLNTRHSREVGILLTELNRWHGLTVVLVTHNPELAKMANTVIELHDGKIFSRSDGRAPDEDSI